MCTDPINTYYNIRTVVWPASGGSSELQIRDMAPMWPGAASDTWVTVQCGWGGAGTVGVRGKSSGVQVVQGRALEL